MQLLKIFKGQGHGWMSWGEWSTCSRTCGKSGTRQRFRACGTCENPDKNGLCDESKISSTNPYIFMKMNREHCPDKGEIETETCKLGFCLPNSSGKWRNFGNKRPFPVKAFWSPAPLDTWTHKAGKDWEGGCVDYNSAYKKVNLDSVSYGNFHSQRATFAECLRVCQIDEGTYIKYF